MFDILIDMPLKPIIVQEILTNVTVALKANHTRLKLIQCSQFDITDTACKRSDQQRFIHVNWCDTQKI